MDSYVTHPGISASNLVQKANVDKVFEADTQAYQTAYADFATEKATYLQNNNLPPETTDYAYSLLTQKNPPPAPAYQLVYEHNFVKSARVYGFLTGAVSYSKIVNKKQLASALAAGKKSLPLRMGLEFNWNIPLYDGLQKKPAGVNYDFNGNNQNIANVKVRFIF